MIVTVGIIIVAAALAYLIYRVLELETELDQRRTQDCREVSILNGKLHVYKTVCDTQKEELFSKSIEIEEKTKEIEDLKAKLLKAQAKKTAKRVKKEQEETSQAVKSVNEKLS